MSSSPEPAPRPEAWRETFASICDRHRARLIAWVSAIFGSRDAEDIAHEALFRLYQRPDLLDPARDAWPWLAVVARNVGRDLARHNAMSTTVEQDVFAALPDEVTVAETVIAREDAERLARALRRLSSRERTVIRLRDFEGASISDIADVVGTSENAVRQQLYRARRRLADVYVALGGDRRLGLPALLGLRLREAVRRYGHVAGTFGPSTAVAAGLVLPATVVVVGGAFGFGPRAPGAAAADPAAAWTTARGTADAFPGHGLGDRAGTATAPGGAARDAAAAAGARRQAAPPRPPMLHARRTLGPADANVTFENSPTSTRGGHNDARVTVVLPNGTSVTVYRTEDAEPGYSVLCTVPVVECRD